MSIQKGVTVNPTLFNPLGEWDSIPAEIVLLDQLGDTVLNVGGSDSIVGNWNSLGSHVCSCDPQASISSKKITHGCFARAISNKAFITF